MFKTQMFSIKTVKSKHKIKQNILKKCIKYMYFAKI